MSKTHPKLVARGAEAEDAGLKFKGNDFMIVFYFFKFQRFLCESEGGWRWCGDVGGDVWVGVVMYHSMHPGCVLLFIIWAPHNSPHISTKIKVSSPT